MSSPFGPRPSALVEFYRKRFNSMISCSARWSAAVSSSGSTHPAGTRWNARDAWFAVIAEFVSEDQYLFPCRSRPHHMRSWLSGDPKRQAARPLPQAPLSTDGIDDRGSTVKATSNRSCSKSSMLHDKPSCTTLALSVLAAWSIEFLAFALRLHAARCQGLCRQAGAGPRVVLYWPVLALGQTRAAPRSV